MHCDLLYSCRKWINVKQISSVTHHFLRINAITSFQIRLQFQYLSKGIIINDCAHSYILHFIMISHNAWNSNIDSRSVLPKLGILLILLETDCSKWLLLLHQVIVGLSPVVRDLLVVLFLLINFASILILLVFPVWTVKHLYHLSVFRSDLFVRNILRSGITNLSKLSNSSNFNIYVVKFLLEVFIIECLTATMFKSEVFILDFVRITFE